jgi:hypothetical protein
MHSEWAKPPVWHYPLIKTLRRECGRGITAMSVEVHIEPERLIAYRELIDGLDIEDHRKDEMIGIVVSVMQAFVDNAFGISGSQLAIAKGDLKASFQSVASDKVQNRNNKLGDPANEPSDHRKPEP